MQVSTLLTAMKFASISCIIISVVKSEELQQHFGYDAVALTSGVWSSRQLLEVKSDVKTISEAKEKDDQLKNDIVDIESDNVKVSGHDNSEVTSVKVEKTSTGITHAFVASLSVIIVSELGDKTFFIAAIMAMKHSRLTVLIGALAALFFMTVLSALVGFATTVIPKALTYYASSALFAIFGIKMLREGWNMSPDEGQEEYEEVQADLKKREDELEKQKAPTQDIETGIIRTPGRHFFSGILSTIFLQALTLTFLAEWGDRSQLATIILAARENVYGVIIGGCLGHALCTGLAVIGGRFIAQRISVRTVTLIGGVVFLIFALSAFWIGPD